LNRNVRPERRKSGRRRTDKPTTDPAATLTNEGSAGKVQHDERGEARWAWSTAQNDALDRTFDELKALDNEALTLLESEPVAARPRNSGGYNPYDAAAVKKRKTKPRR
jgi:hypothetical protein